MGWTIRALERARLARSATRYAAHGWDVVPGAAFTGDRFRCDDPACPTVGCHPATGFWQDAATRDPAVVAAWWRRASYAVLLPTGRAFDVLDVPAALGILIAHSGGPVAVTPYGRWLFLVRPGDGLRPELADHCDVLRHGLGSWIPAPPTREPMGRTRWRVTPDQVDWRVPNSYEVQDRLVAALVAMSPTGAVRVVAARSRDASRWPMNPPHTSLTSARRTG